MKLNYYYAELNDNNVCIRIISSTTRMGGGRYVEIPEFNETLYRYKKYDPDTQWSAESYEPDVDTEIQDNIIRLAETVSELKVDNTNLSEEVLNLNTSIHDLNGVIMELTTMISILQGGK